MAAPTTPSTSSGGGGALLPFVTSCFVTFPFAAGLLLRLAGAGLLLRGAGLLLRPRVATIALVWSLTVKAAPAVKISGVGTLTTYTEASSVAR